MLSPEKRGLDFKSILHLDSCALTASPSMVLQIFRLPGKCSPDPGYEFPASLFKSIIYGRKSKIIEYDESEW